MYMTFIIDMEEYVAALSLAEKEKYKEEIQALRELLLEADRLKEDIAEGILPDNFCAGLAKDLLNAFLDLYTAVRLERDAFGKGVSVELVPLPGWVADIDWSSAGHG